MSGKVDILSSSMATSPSSPPDVRLDAFVRQCGDDVPSADIRFDVSLATLARWRIGGRADAVVTPSTRSALAATLRAIDRTGVPHVVIGDGSNLLFDDAGFRGVVVRVGRAFSDVEIDSSGLVRAGAGIWVPAFVRRVIDAGLGGIVHAIGIPGTLGGLCVMNGGSQRKGIGEHIVSIEAMDYAGVVHSILHADLNFAYRRSALQTGELVVIGATLQLDPRPASLLRREAITILADRRAKFPKVRANCGSVFVSDPKLYAIIGPPGLAIERAGLKGVRCGDAQISPDHANFIVNNGNARSHDVLTLIHSARDRVYALSGIAMEAEVRHVSPDGVLRPAHDCLPVNKAGFVD